ncbi:MAG: ABC transporter ATP-binding protein [Acidimicrobiales bacterium]
MWQNNSAEHVPTRSEAPPSTAEKARQVAGLSSAAGRVAGRPHCSSPAIHTVELSKQYRHAIALDGLSMTVARGEIFGFLGPNGAGKTTAVKLLLGLVHASGGEAMVLGAPAGDVATRRHIGYLPELFRFQAWLTAREVLLLHCRLLRLAKPTWRDEVAETLATVGLSDRAGDKVGAFSKGMQQRLGLGVALLGEPELVMLDEPTSALDPLGRHDVRSIVRTLKSRGTTVFLNTHLLEEVEHVCDRVAVIDRGRTIATGTLSELVGQQSSVRLHVIGLGEAHRTELSCFGAIRSEPAPEVDGEWLLVESIAADQVPALVRTIVRLGGDVMAVVPARKSLEARFLELLGAS